MDDAYTPRIKELEAEIAPMQANVDQKQSALNLQNEQMTAQHAANLAPVQNDLMKSLNQPTPMRPAQTPLPTAPDKMQIDQKEYTGLATALLGMALIGGAKSHGNWLGASASLNGALEGYLDGNMEKAKIAYQDYETKFKAAQAHDKQINDAYESVLADRKLTISEKFQKVSLIAAENGQEAAKMLAKQKTIDGLEKLVQDQKKELAKVEDRQISMRQSLLNSLQTIAKREENKKDDLGGNGKLPPGITPEAVDQAAWMYIVKSDKPSARLAPFVEARIAEIAKENGMSPQELALASADVKTQLMAKRTTEMRIQNTMRAENIMKAEIPRVEDAMAKIKLPDNPTAAAAEISLIKNGLGSKENRAAVAQFQQAVDVVYKEFESLTTGNGGTLNVQDVVAAKEKAKEAVAPTEMKAVIAGMKIMIENAKAGNKTTRGEIMDDASAAVSPKKDIGKGRQVTKGDVDAYAKKHGLTPEQAQQYVKEHNFVVVGAK